jgi:hypothetical protein
VIGRKLVESVHTHRDLLASDATVAVTSNVNLPPGSSLADATYYMAAFYTACTNIYTKGQLSVNYGITKADVIISPPIAYTYSESASSSNNNLALGLGLGIGLGVGIPLIVGIAYIVIKKRRGIQEVAPAAV